MTPECEQLIPAFRDETEEGLLAIEESLLALRDQPDDSAALATIFRVAHTIKGNAYSLGLRQLGDLAHALEDQLDRVRSGAVSVGPAILERLLRAVDALRDVCARSLEGDDQISEQQRALLRELHDGVADGAIPERAVIEPAAPRGARKTLRVDTGKLDRILTLTSSLAVARGQLAQALGGDAAANTSDLLSELERTSRELHEEVLRARAVPVATAFRPQARVVHDAALATGKRARLEVEGDDVEADTAVIDGIRDVLGHLVRNAVAHGIEAPEARQAAGKNPVGTVRLRARQEAGGLVIEVSDDGAGFSRDRLVSAARVRGVATPETLDDIALRELAFTPGFTTADAISDVSGRGVGLDVVRESIEALRGSVTVESTAGVGATFTLRLPLTLAIIDGFAISVAAETYVVPMEQVLECLELPLAAAAATGIVELRGSALPYVALRSIFPVSTPLPRRQCLLVVAAGAKQAGLVVDVLLGACQVVQKPLSRVLRGSPGLAGSAVLGNGRVGLVLDVATLVRDCLDSFRPKGVAA